MDMVDTHEQPWLNQNTVWATGEFLSGWECSGSDPGWSRTEKFLLETQAWTSPIHKDIFDGGATQPKVAVHGCGNVILMLLLS